MKLSLKNKFLIPTLTLIVLGMSISSTVSYMISKDAIETVIKAQLVQITDSTEKHLSSWIRIADMEIARWSGQEYFKMAVRDTFMGQASRRASDSYLKQEKQRYAYYESLNLANEKGEVVSSSEENKTENVSDRQYFQNAIKGESFVSDIFLSPFSKQPVFIISYPVKENEMIVGVFFGVINLKYFDSTYIAPLKIGRQGYAFMINKEGLFTAHPDNSVIFKLTAKDSDSGIAMMAKNDGLIAYTFKDVEKLTAFKKNKETGWIIAVNADRSDIMTPAAVLERMNFFIGISLVAVVSVVILLIVRSVVKPVNDVIAGVRIIASGNFCKSIRSERHDEIGQLASDVEKMRLAIKDLTDNLKEQERLKSEMELAKKIQTVLLPKKPEISGYEIAASCEPADEVGGDYYDVISVVGFDWIVIGDVSGHGITAGLVMMMVQTAIHTVLIQNPEVPPSQMLRVINRTIYENILLMSESKHMTIIVLACGKGGFFDFSGLHEDILLWCADTKKVEKIATDGMWIGLEPDISGYLSDDALKMEPGDCIVLYTDGITEAIGKDGELFGEKRLIKAIESCCGRSASEIHSAVLKEMESFEKPDDVTLFVMKRI